MNCISWNYLIAQPWGSVKGQLCDFWADEGKESFQYLEQSFPDHCHSPLQLWNLDLRVKVKSLSHVQLFVIPWTVAYKVPPSMGFSRQEYWRVLPFPSPGDLPDPGLNLGLLHCKQMILPSEPPGKLSVRVKGLDKWSRCLRSTGWAFKRFLKCWVQWFIACN